MGSEQFDPNDFGLYLIAALKDPQIIASVNKVIDRDQYWITNTKQRLHKSSWIVVRNVWKIVIKTVLSQSTYIPMWSLKS